MLNSRRDLLKHLGVLFSIAPFRVLADLLQSVDLAPGAMGAGNFSYIYNDSKRRQAFLPFLTNVFHLYPDEALHHLITQVTAKYSDDSQIYRQLQKDLPAIKPSLSEVTYAMPALVKQKQVIAEQTRDLVGELRQIDGYLEFGSAGRYLDALEEIYSIGGRRYFVADHEPSHSPVDIVDRGQWTVGGEFFPLDKYRIDLQEKIPLASLDMVTVYIGFHHCPVALRDAFIGGVRSVLKPGGFLVVRDHDAHDEEMRRCVSLAHDVFNMGTGEVWDYNAAELRNFYSLELLDGMLSAHGFKSDGRKLFQTGDPTRNALMLYRKV